MGRFRWSGPPQCFWGEAARGFNFTNFIGAGAIFVKLVAMWEDWLILDLADPPDRLRCENGAGEGIRTLDPNLGKVVLYP